MSDSDDLPLIYLYPDVVGFAVFVIMYTVGSGMSAGFAHLLFRLNGKQVVYVSLMSLSIFVQNMLTVVQEAFSFAEWPIIQAQTYESELGQWRNPDASIVYQTSPNLFIRVIFNMRTYFFNVESLLFFFWSLMLFISVWEIENRVLKSEKFVAGTKYFAFLFPLFQLILTNLGAVKAVPALHLFFGIFTMAVTLSAGCIFMGLILFKCLHVMWTSSWAQKVQGWRGYDNGQVRLRRPGTSYSTGSNSDNEDRYILLRFLAGFVIIGGLQTSFMASQVTYAYAVLKRKQPNAEKPHLGWNKHQQLADWAFYLASGSTGYLILIVFGTTRESRRQARRLWDSLCGKVRFGQRKDGEYISFPPDHDPASYDARARPIAPDTRELSERRRAPGPMTFVDSRTPNETADPFSPSYKDVDLKTPLHTRSGA